MYAPHSFVSKFVKDGHKLTLAQSYAKNFGLYGQRIGMFSVVCADKEESERTVSQLKILARAMYSNPPIYGAQIVATILGDPKLNTQW
jgi:aspartate aminotransferase